MTYEIEVKRSGNSKVIRLSKSICDLYGIDEGSIIEISPFTQDSLVMKIRPAKDAKTNFSINAFPRFKY